MFSGMSWYWKGVQELWDLILRNRAAAADVAILAILRDVFRHALLVIVSVQHTQGLLETEVDSRYLIVGFTDE